MTNWVENNSSNVTFQPSVYHWQDMTASDENCERIFRRLSRMKHCLFLDSAVQVTSGQGHPLGRYSFLTADPIEWIECAPGVGTPFELLRRTAERYSASRLPEFPPFQGGLAGMISYDANRSLERILPPRHDEFQLPALALGIYDVVVAVDHCQNTIHILSQGWPETGEARRRQAQARLDEFVRLLTNGDYDSSTPRVLPNKEIPLTKTHSVGDQLYSNFSKPEYLDAVQRCIDYIHAGDVFQVNLAQRLIRRANLSSKDLYLKLRRGNPAPFGGYLDVGNAQILSTSPERFLQTANGWVETRPIKGTRRRTSYPEVDLRVGHQLESSPKDRAENTMIVDLMRNDLSRVCTDDSIDVTQWCRLESYQSVLHLVSAVRGKLRSDRDVFDLLWSAFPGGSITGAPKVRAMQIIQELEPTARGAYCGSLGYCSSDGVSDWNILIRTITSSGGWWQIPVGGGIVSDSTPEEEYQETWTKAAGMLQAIES